MCCYFSSLGYLLGLGNNELKFQAEWVDYSSWSFTARPTCEVSWVFPEMFVLNHCFGSDFFFFWATPVGSQGLFLAEHHSRNQKITPGRLRRPYGIPMIEPASATCKAGALTCSGTSGRNSWMFLITVIKYLVSGARQPGNDTYSAPC